MSFGAAPVLPIGARARASRSQVVQPGSPIQRPSFPTPGSPIRSPVRVGAGPVRIPLARPGAILTGASLGCASPVHRCGSPIHRASLSLSPLHADPKKWLPRAGTTGRNLEDWHGTWMKLVKRETPASRRRNAALVDAKSANAANGLETSTFVVCARIRPVLQDEQGGSMKFACVVPGEGKGKAEEALLLQPRLTMQGRPKLEPSTNYFDHVFGPEDDNETVYESVGRPLVKRALDGQVGVIFAYGQTGAGKTHTMSALLDRFTEELFREPRAVSFSYFDILGTTVRDCLVAKQPPRGVQIGEALDGRIVPRDLSTHTVTTAAEFRALLAVAKSRRMTASTERNAESSRSHGVAIVSVGQPGAMEGVAPTDGVLYVIDLAGSERAADSKGHSKERMAETKQINLSLMALKECIRARTLASAPGAAASTHVPFRRSKLTLLLKDVFDYTCTRICATVVIASVSPLAIDVGHSANTLKYAAPLRVAGRPRNDKLQRDERDPALWTRDQIVDWIATVAPTLDAEQIIKPKEQGVHFCQVSEPELFRRAERQRGPEGAEIAQQLHAALWTLIVDAKTRKRRPDGQIITEEEEEREIAAKQEQFKDKLSVWAEREKHLKSGF